MTIMQVKIKQEQALTDFVINLKQRFSDYRFYSIKAPLGLGKTTFVKYFVKTLKATNAVDLVKSPTFTIVNVYDLAQCSVYHYDFYRIGVAQFIARGLNTFFYEEGYHFMENADKNIEDLIAAYGFKNLSLCIEAGSGNTRIFKVHG